MLRLRPVVTSVVAWTVGAVTAVGVGLLALSLIRSGLTDDAFQPLAPDSVAQADRGANPSPGSSGGLVTPAGTPSTPASPRTPASSERRVTSAGGTVLARCQGGLAYLVYWTPQPPFRAENVNRGPAALVRLTFEAPNREITVTFVCVGGVPQPAIDTDWSDDGHE